MVMDHFGVVYCITHIPSGKIYIGQTTRSLNKRLAEHSRGGKSKISKAIKKYGWDNFKVSILDSASSKDDLDTLEKTYIDMFNSFDRITGFNLKDGGSSGSHHEETRLKLSKAHIGKTLDLEHRNKISKALTGIKRSESTKSKMGVCKIGDKNPNAHKVVCLDTGEVFNSLSEVESKLHLWASNISACCRGTLKTSGGFHWAYVQENKDVI